MSEDQFERRGNALEDMFFYRSDQELLEQIKQDLADKEAREQLACLLYTSDAADE